MQPILPKRDMTEEDIKLQYITPALTAKWSVGKITMETRITDGKINLKGNLVFREKPKRADYILYLSANNPIAIVEAKDNRHSISYGLQQAIEYARMLDLPFAYSSNGDGFAEHDFLTGKERQFGLGVPFISVRNISDGRLNISNAKLISQEEHEEFFKRCNPEKGDILLSKIGTTGVPAKVDTDEAFSLFVSVALLKFDMNLIDRDFLVYALLTPNVQKQCKEHTRGVGNKNWVIKDIANTIFPLPPLAEQKRIVAKLEELLPLCEKLK